MDTCDALSQPVLCSMGRHPLHWQFRTHFPAEGHFVKAALSKSNSATLLVMDAEFAFVHFQGTTLMHNVKATLKCIRSGKCRAAMCIHRAAISFS